MYGNIFLIIIIGITVLILNKNPHVEFLSALGTFCNVLSLYSPEPQLRGALRAFLIDVISVLRALYLILKKRHSLSSQTQIFLIFKGSLICVFRKNPEKSENIEKRIEKRADMVRNKRGKKTKKEAEYSENQSCPHKEASQLIKAVSAVHKAH